MGLNLRWVFIVAYALIGAAALVFLLVLLFVNLLAAVLWFGVIVLATVIVVIQSVHSIGPDEMLARYFTGTFEWTYVTRKYLKRYLEALKKQAAQRGQLLTDEDEQALRANVRTGFLESDYVFVLWVPLVRPWRIVRFPAAAKIPLHAGSIYTSDIDDPPRVRLQMDATGYISVNPAGIGRLVERMPSLFRQGTEDLVQTVELCDEREGKMHTHRVLLMAKVIHASINEKVLDALRKASSSFTWGRTKPATVTLDIISNKLSFENLVKWHLSDPDSILVLAGILAPQADQPIPDPADPSVKIAMVYGDAALAFDFVVELIKPEPAAEGESEFSKAIDAPMVGHLEGRKQELLEKLKREGQAAGLKKIAMELGLKDDDQAIVLIAERLQQAGINVFDFGEGGAALLDAARRLVKRKKPPTSPPPTSL